MRLDQLTLQNYRCFDSVTIQFHPELTVLIAPNGAGKTTVLDAARVALWPFVKGFDLGSQTGKAATVQISDVRMRLLSGGNMEPQIPCAIEALGDWSPERLGQRWVQTRERVKVNTGTLGDNSTKKMTQYAKVLEKQVRDGQSTTLPLITYLGTSRLWYEGRFSSSAAATNMDKSDYSRTSGYLNCLAYSSRFKAFSAWYSWVYRSYSESRFIALEQNTPFDSAGNPFAHIVQVVKVAVDALVKKSTGWHSLEFSERHHQQLVMHHDQHGVMPVDILSDGLRNTIAMVADIAFRAYKLNPHWGIQAARETPGIALIDEVDMFLHPAWQQTILGSLKEAFPKLQFIVSTHSPQVTTSIPSESIRVLSDGKVFAAPPGTEGAESSRLLTRLFGVNSRPPETRATQELNDYLKLIYANKWDEPSTKALRTVLDARYRGEEPALTAADLHIENQKWERSLDAIDGDHIEDRS
jgi:predicted ATP-binding protein involved in virulence